MRSPKLYELVRRVDLPSHASRDPVSGDYIPILETLPATFGVFWPDGTPCVHVEMYLLDIARSYTVRELDGGSLKVKVSNLSPLIRYCFDIRTDFESLMNDDFRDFAIRLQNEPHHSSPGFKKRNGNTVNAILDDCITFLQWLQSNLFIGRVIVGTRERGPQICLVSKRYEDSRGVNQTKLVFPYRPPRDTRDPKLPITRGTRNKLWDAVAELARPERARNRYFRRNISEADALAEIDFLRARREILLYLLEATGARPGELARLLMKGDGTVDYSTILLTTLKRRRAIDPIRSVPLDSAVAMKLSLFVFKHRAQLLSRLRARGIRVEPTDHVFLNSRDGTPMTEQALEKEFQRIVKRASVTERACMSMFRHRFVTNMIRLHLQEFLDNAPGKTRALMTESDYRTILHRVAAFTGHRDVDSLFHYFDAVWEEMGVFDYVQPAREIAQVVETSISTMISLAAQLELRPTLSKRELLDVVLAELGEMKRRTISAIDACTRQDR